MTSLASRKPVLRLKAFRPAEPKPCPTIVDVQPPVEAQPGVTEAKAAKPTRSAAITTMRRELIKRFPHCFKSFRDRKLALKIGIYQDILARAPDLDPGIVQSAIGQYVYCSDYYSIVVEGKVRLDLDGNPEGTVTAEEAAHAADRCKAKKTASC